MLSKILWMSCLLAYCSAIHLCTYVFSDCGLSFIFYTEKTDGESQSTKGARAQRNHANSTWTHTGFEQEPSEASSRSCLTDYVTRYCYHCRMFVYVCKLNKLANLTGFYRVNCLSICFAVSWLLAKLSHLLSL